MPSKVIPFKRRIQQSSRRPITTAIRISNRQYAALKLFTDTTRPMQIDVALSVDQRSLGSLFHNEYIRYNGHGFVITPLGKQVVGTFENTNVIKEKAGIALSTYFNVVKALNLYQRRTA